MEGQVDAIKTTIETINKLDDLGQPNKNQILGMQKYQQAGADALQAVVLEYFLGRIFNLGLVPVVQ